MNHCSPRKNAPTSLRRAPKAFIKATSAVLSKTVVPAVDATASAAANNAANVTSHINDWTRERIWPSPSATCRIGRTLTPGSFVLNCGEIDDIYGVHYQRSNWAGFTYLRSLC